MQSISQTKLSRFWQGPAMSVLLSVVYPTLFVLSQNWYSLSIEQVVWLLVVAFLAGLAIYALVEGLLRAASFTEVHFFKRAPADDSERRAIVFGAVCAGLLFLLLFRTLKSALQNSAFLVLAFSLLAAALIFAFRRNLHRYVNGFLAIISLVAVSGWAVNALDQTQAWLANVQQDFESAKFKRKPNVYLLNYDGYGSEDLYRKVFDIDNSAQYQALAARNFKVLHTFSNYRDTLQTTIGVFLGAHHYYRTATGFSDSQKGRPFLAGVVHNPSLSTFKSNGYHLQYIHGIDYFVNEPGLLDFMYPPKPMASALRVFDIPLLRMKRHISIDDQREVLYSKIPAPARQTNEPWFTFAHINKPSHADLAVRWTELAYFPQLYRERTEQANTHMLETIDRIRGVDPDAVIVIYGDHGSHRYNKIWQAPDPNAEFAKAGVPVEHVTLDQFGIMIAVASGGACDNYFYAGLTPVNILRAVFACLSEDQSLLNAKVDDTSLFKGAGDDLWRAADRGKILPAWEPYKPGQ